MTEAREVEDGRAERGSHPAQGRVGELTFWGRPPMLKKHFEQVWNQLRSKRPQMRNYLERVRIEGLRGIKDLKVVFQYPVSVLAGPNASGKTTVLFALACAYRKQGDFPGRYPSEVFPGLRRQKPEDVQDRLGTVALDFTMIEDGNSIEMRWRHGQKWNRSFFGRKHARQPVRPVYLRTMANLTNPSEVRRFLQMGRRALKDDKVPAELLVFAHRILQFRYSAIRVLTCDAQEHDLLFAIREEPGNLCYSEFQMSAGERAVLRLSRDISRLRDALVLIDELEAGLHPFTQQQLMLELQRLALRNDLLLSPPIARQCSRACLRRRGFSWNGPVRPSWSSRCFAM